MNLPKPDVLIVDDELDIRELVGDILIDEGYSVRLAGNASEARSLVAELRPGLVLLDIWMPELDGVSLLREWVSSNSLHFPVVMMSGHGTVETAVEATRLGAVDFVEKPISMAKLFSTIEKAVSYWQSQSNSALPTAKTEPNPIVGISHYINDLRNKITAVAKLNDGVMICGPSASGKTLVAEHIHHQSDRSNGPLVLLRADAIDAQLGAAELFGVDTQEQQMQGLLEKASGGTVHLLALDEMSNANQALLLNALQNKSFRRLGGRSDITLDVRFIASSDSLFAEMIENGFDPELYHRLAVIEIETLPLSMHLEDVPSIVESFVQRFSSEEKLSYRHFDVSAQNALRNKPLFGGVRELRNIVKRALTLGKAGDITASEVEGLIKSRVETDDEGVLFKIPMQLALRDARTEFEKNYLQRQLRASQGSMQVLAQRTGMERTHLYRKLRNLGIDPKKDILKS